MCSVCCASAVLDAASKGKPQGKGPKLSISLNIAEDLNTPDKIKTTADDFGITQKELKRLMKEAFSEKQ